MKNGLEFCCPASKYAQLKRLSITKAIKNNLVLNLKPETGKLSLLTSLVLVLVRTKLAWRQAKEAIDLSQPTLFEYINQKYSAI